MVANIAQGLQDDYRIKNFLGEARYQSCIFHLSLSYISSNSSSAAFY